MESVVNFHNTMWMIKRANVEAFNGVESNMQSLMSQFSDGANVEKQKADFQEHMKLLMHAIIAVTLLLSALTGGVGSAMALSAATSAQLTATILLEDAAEQLIADAALIGARYQAASAAFTGLSAVEVGTVSVVTDLLAGP